MAVVTHMSSYGNASMAVYTFETTIKFLQCWANIKLSNAPLLKLALPIKRSLFQPNADVADLAVYLGMAEMLTHKKTENYRKNCLQLENPANFYILLFDRLVKLCYCFPSN